MLTQMVPADIGRQVVLEGLDLAPGAERAVVARRSIQRGRYVSRLWTVPLDTRKLPHALTDGRVYDSSPRISPDGRFVAFLRSDPDDNHGAKRLCVMPLAGGRVRVCAPKGVRPGHGAIGEFAWAPDSLTIAFTAQVDPPRWIVGPVRMIGSAATRVSPVARRITRTDWRFDGEGHLDYWAHLFVVDVIPVAGRPRQLTAGNWGVSDLAWHPDGAAVAFVADLGERADLRPRPAVYSVARNASMEAAPTALLQAGGAVRRPALSPNGRWVVGVGVLGADAHDEVAPSLLIGPGGGSGPAKELSSDLDRPITNWADTDLNGWKVRNPVGPCWLDESTIVAVVTDRGRSLPQRWTIDPSTGDPIETPKASPRYSAGPYADATVAALAVARATTEKPAAIAVLGTLGGRAMELMTIDLRAAEPAFNTRTTMGSRWQKRHPYPTMSRVEVPSAGGPIETWIASPADAGEAPLPTIVNLHGGPLGCWAPAPAIEVMLLTGAGYRVVLPNIRGSAGYGEQWIRPQLGDWGGIDAQDVHTVVDWVLAMGLAAPDRLGLLGLSYGGFLVNWLVGTSDRFAAAVSENGVTNNVSAWANSDYGPEYSRMAHLGNVLSPEGIDRLWRQSPLRNVADVHTPLLMFQAEADLRCPPQDNEQFFIALRHLGRTAEYVLYPEESHVYATTGRPDRRIDRMTRMLDWYERYL